MEHTIILNESDIIKAVYKYMYDKGYDVKRYRFLINATYDGVFVRHKADVRLDGLRLVIDDLKN